MKITGEIMGVDIDFNKDDEIVFRFMGEDDEWWSTDELEIDPRMIFEFLEVLEEAGAYARSKRHGEVSFQRKHVSIDTYKNKGSEEQGIKMLLGEKEVNRFSAHWLPDMTGVMKLAKSYCEQIGIEPYLEDRKPVE
jgi:hypothetical protein